MKKLLSILAFLPFVVLLAACEEIIDPEGLPYEEKMVIHGIIFADSANSTIQISRTLPLDVRFDTNIAYLRDAKGSVSDGSTTYPLEYIGYSGKYRIVGLTPQLGKSYELNVRWRDLSAAATMEMPSTGGIDTTVFAIEETRFGYKRLNVTSVVRIQPRNSVLVDHFVITNDWPQFLNGYAVYGDHERQDDGSLLAKSSLHGDIDESPVRTIVSRAYIFSPRYYEYYLSKNVNTDVDLGNPAVVQWNVRGDAIGIFFGCKIVEREFHY